MTHGLTFDPDGHVYLFGGRRRTSATEVLSGLNLHRGAAYFTEEGRERGKFVHSAIQFWMGQDLVEDQLDSRLAPYLAAAKTFMGDVGLDPFSGRFAIEDPTYSAELDLAGTPDLVGPIFANEAILDWKSGGADPVTGLQTALYDLILGGPRRRRYALQLRPTGTYKLIPFKDPVDYRRALAALDLFRTYNPKPKEEESHVAA